MSVTVCHVTSVHRFNDSRILQKECLSLAKKYKVYLVAPNIESFDYNGVSIRGVSLPKSRISRLFKLKQVFRLLKEIDADIYHFHDPELMSMGLRVKRLGKKIIFDSHEDIPLDIAEKKYIPGILRFLLSNYFKIYERFALKRYDAVISVTPTIVDKLKKINSNTYQVTNYPLLHDIEDNRAWGDSICFAGQVSANWMHVNIIKALDNLSVEYNLAGPTTEDYYNELTNLSNWPKVNYKGELNPKEIPSFLQQSTVGLAIYNYLPSFGYKMGSLGNNKIFEYMAAGIPIIATNFKLWKEIIADQKCGICVEPYDIHGINEAIKYLIAHKNIAKKMGDKGRKLVKDIYNWSSQEQILYELYESISIHE